MIFNSWSRLVNFYSGLIIDLLSQGEKQPWEHLASNPAFQEQAQRVANAMVGELAKVNARSWREAAFKSQNGRKIYKALQEEIKRTHLQSYLDAIAERNASLIRSLPSKIALQVTEHAQTLFQEGKRPEEIQRELRLVAPRMTKAHARLIARTEISRSETDLTRARSENIDIPAYAWQSSEDQRVRPSHRKMDKVIVFWNDPPSPEELIGEKSVGRYHCGQIWNCRCLSLPVVALDEISWPARVYRSGSITRYTRAKFAALAGYEKAA
jgi:SPP1 gp7 family putative phage head morphogenesis protein